SRLAGQKPSVDAEWAGLVVGGLLSAAGIVAAWRLYVYRPGATDALRERYARVHGFLFHKWYFDELYDALFVRPAAAFGRFGQTVVESAFVQGVVIGGATAAVRAGTELARGIQNGYPRAYALVPVIGLSGLGLYLLLQA